MRDLCAIIAAWTSVAAVAGNVRAYTPTRWIGDAVAVPEGVRGAEVAATFVDGGGEEVQLFLRQFDAAGKPVGDCSAAPRMPPLAPSLRGKPWTFTAVVEGAKLRPGAARQLGFRRGDHYVHGRVSSRTERVAGRGRGFRRTGRGR